MAQGWKTVSMVFSNPNHSVSLWFYGLMKRKLGWKSLDAYLPLVHTKSGRCTMAVADKQGLAHSPQGWHHGLCFSIRVSKSFGHDTVGFWPALGQCHSAYRRYICSHKGKIRRHGEGTEDAQLPLRCLCCSEALAVTAAHTSCVGLVHSTVR